MSVPITQVSPDFRKKTTHAIFAIVLFIITYVALVYLAGALALFCCFGGLMVIGMGFSFITILLGGGIVIMGGLIFFFLIKFIFKKHKVDRSHLVEITRQDEPELFQFIEEIVREVNTSFPKRIYLSADVNASVFYDSSFWSMIFPVKKNLQIGLGLVNSVTVVEFKAILAHEFGHFSQRSMKVGSYVYNVNQVIHNMLFENDSYGSIAQSLANIHGIVALFVNLAFKIVAGIQWILSKVYQVVNLNYMSLSREMEFHADEVAANVAGSAPLATSLLRLGLANHCYNKVLEYYNEKIHVAVKTRNIYPLQYFVMNLQAKSDNLPIEHELPQVSLDSLQRYNKSKLQIKDQWASHPSNEDRIARLNVLSITKSAAAKDFIAANSLFKKLETLQTKLTDGLFSAVKYKTPVSDQTTEQFTYDYQKEFEANAPDKLFNGYYDFKAPGLLDIERIQTNANPPPLTILFGHDNVELVLISMALGNDLNILKQIAAGGTNIKTFDYDGLRYSTKNINTLISRLEKELAETNEKIEHNDIDIYSYFLLKAERQHKTTQWKEKCNAFYTFDKICEQDFETFNKLVEQVNFIQQNLPVDHIRMHMIDLKKTENRFREILVNYLDDIVFQLTLTGGSKEVYSEYLEKDWIYFQGEHYSEKNLHKLFAAINHFQPWVGRVFFQKKKELLNEMSALENNS